MKNVTIIQKIKIPIKAIVFIVFFCIFTLKLNGQSITIYQYRQVPPDKMEEFLKRETTYWSKVAEAAIEKGNLEFWGVFQKIGGIDQPNSSNVLFVNTFKDIDATNGIWDAASIFPDVPMEDMETYSMSTVMHTFFLRAENFVQLESAVPEDDFNYLNIIYHNSDSPGQLIALEKEHWLPFIKESMDAGKTKQKAWGNSIILHPSGPDIKATTISIDIFKTLKEVLNPTWDEDTVFPNEELGKINELELTRRISAIYRVVKVVNNN